MKKMLLFTRFYPPKFDPGEKSDIYQSSFMLAWQLLKVSIKIKNVLVWGFAPTFGLAFLFGLPDRSSSGVLESRITLNLFTGETILKR